MNEYECALERDDPFKTKETFSSPVIFGGRAVGFRGVPRFFQSSIFPANKKDANICVQPLDIFRWV